MARSSPGFCLITLAALNLLPLHAMSLGGADLPGAQSEYLLDVWQSDDGLPQNSVISMAQTSDGYLWLSTFSGLARFDGRHFEVFDGDTTPALAGEVFTTLRADAHGNLWLRGEEGRIVIGRNGRFRRLGEQEGVPVSGLGVLQAAPDGSIWAGDLKGRLLRFEGGKFAPVKQEPPASDWGPLFSLQFDTEGNVWTVTGSRCARLAGGQWSVVYSEPSGKQIGAMQALRGGGVALVAGPNQDRLLCYTSREFLDLGAIPGGFHWYFVAEDPAGDLWVCFDDGVLRRDTAGHWSKLTRAEGLPADSVRSELLDREGNRWFGTDGGGLVRLNRRSVWAYGLTQGMSKTIALSVAVHGSNDAWVAVLRGGLNRFDMSRFSQLSSPGLLGPESLVWSVTTSQGGGAWLGMYADGLFRLDGAGRVLQVFNSQTAKGMVDGPIMKLFETRQGDLWLGGNTGLCRYANGRFQCWTATNGLPDDQVNSIAEADLGAIWVATQSGLSRIASNVVTKFAAPNGLKEKSPQAVFVDSKHDLWIGGHLLTRFRDGRFVTIRGSDGLPERVIKGIAEDNLGFLWFSTAHGIVRANRDDLDHFCDTRQGRPRFWIFTKADGLPSNECSDSQPAIWKAADGRLWFATLNGLAIIDPRNIPENKLAPPTVIEAVVADGKTLDLAESAGDEAPKVIVPAGTLRLEIQFAGLSFTAPEKNRFRCQLEGFDPDWVDPGGSATASYTHLPPGTYCFHAAASNNDGVWNNEGAWLTVVVAPLFWQTQWFRALVVFTVAAMIVLLVLRRLALAERRRQTQEIFTRKLIETQETERQRIARELHDGAGQMLLLAKNRLSSAMKHVEPASFVAGPLEQASAELSQAIEEVRATARALRPVELDRLGLGKAIESMLERTRSTTEMRFLSELDDVEKLVGREIEIQLYRIAQEAINNILKHSNAREVIVELKNEQTELRLTVQDDGVGFDAEAAERKGGSGLSGMAERARLIGGVLSVRAAAGRGCRLTVTVPLRRPSP